MKGKVLVVINGIGSLMSGFNILNSVSNLERVAWICSFIFAFIAMLNQVDINRLNDEKEIDE